MANYKKITDVEVMSEVTENSMALINENGVLKQVPAGGFGGGGIMTAIWEGDLFGGGVSCTNMTFQEAADAMQTKPLSIIFKSIFDDMLHWMTSLHVTKGTTSGGIQYICVCFYNDGDYYYAYWTANGISNEFPGQTPA